MQRTLLEVAAAADDLVAIFGVSQREPASLFTVWAAGQVSSSRGGGLGTTQSHCGHPCMQHQHSCSFASGLAMCFAAVRGSYIVPICRYGFAASASGAFAASAAVPLHLFCCCLCCSRPVVPPTSCCVMCSLQQLPPALACTQQYR